MNHDFVWLGTLREVGTGLAAGCSVEAGTVVEGRGADGAGAATVSDFWGVTSVDSLFSQARTVQTKTGMASNSTCR